MTKLKPWDPGYADEKHREEEDAVLRRIEQRAVQRANAEAQMLKEGREVAKVRAALEEYERDPGMFLERSFPEPETAKAMLDFMQRAGWHDQAEQFRRDYERALARRMPAQAFNPGRPIRREFDPASLPMTDPFFSYNT